jgi:peptidoglycan/LPS O-acetylase OafA/YrhL
MGNSACQECRSMLAQSEPRGNTAVSSSPSFLPKIGPKGRLDYPELDGTRFCAFLAVFVFHGTQSLRKPGNSLSDLCSAASFGLPLFFVLSSYLITQVLLLERSLTGRVALKAFYVRRALRIWPLYLSFMTANFIAGYFFHSLHIEPARFAAFLLLAGNWYVGAFGFGNNVIYPLWSISVEEQFYLLWPALAGKTVRVLGYSSVVLTFVSLATIYVLHQSGHTSDAIWTNSIADFLFFAVGSLLAIRERAITIKKTTRLGFTLIVLGFASWWPIEHVCHLKSGETPSSLLFMVGYLLVATSCCLIVYGFRSLPTHFFPGWVRYPGKISYGMYVFHKLALHESIHITRHSTSLFANLTASLVLTAILATASYRLLEKPFLRLKRGFEVIDTSRSV